MCRPHSLAVFARGCGLPLLLLFQRDYRDQWDDLAATLPLPTWMVVAEKFLLAAACTVVYP